MVGQYIGDATFAGEGADGEAVQSSKRAWVHKAQLFLGKRTRADAAGSADVVAPPAKKFRGKAALWGVTLSSILQKTTGQSLDFWRVPAGSEAAPSTWPCLGVAPNQGSDGMCFIHYMFEQRVNVHVWFDPSHGVWRDQEAAMKAIGLSGFAFLMVAAFNLTNGPWDSQPRYIQMLEASNEYMQTQAGTCPLLATFKKDLCKN